uniref:Uncharacterized protein n=1 Tax=Oryza glumipatula TaxID=40148 RepID=A0A0E0AI62_9ORYZ
MEDLKEPTLESGRKDHLDEHESFFLEHQESCSLKRMVKHVSRRAAREASPKTVDDGAELARYGGIGMGELIRSCAKRESESG